METRNHNLSTREVETGGSLEFAGQSSQTTELQVPKSLKNDKPGMMVHASHPSTQETKGRYTYVS